MANTSSTSTAAVLALPLPIAFYLAPRVACTWEQVRQCSDVILVERLCDYAVLWQAGFHNLTCSLGTHLNADQFRQLCNRPRTVYLTFDVDANQSGERMVSNVAIENVEWAGRGIPNVCHRRCGVFDCGATRANS
jgi:hypothetical protein